MAETKVLYSIQLSRGRLSSELEQVETKHVLYYEDPDFSDGRPADIYDYSTPMVCFYDEKGESSILQDHKSVFETVNAVNLNFDQLLAGDLITFARIVKDSMGMGGRLVSDLFISLAAHEFDIPEPNLEPRIQDGFLIFHVIWITLCRPGISELYRVVVDLITGEENITVRQSIRVDKHGKQR